MTPFAKFLADSRIDFAAAAEKLDVTRSYIAQLASGKVKPGMKLAKKIFLWSLEVAGREGAVKMEQW